MIKYLSPPTRKGFFSLYKFQTALGNYGPEGQHLTLLAPSGSQRPKPTASVLAPPSTQLHGPWPWGPFAVSFVTLRSINHEALHSKVPIQSCPYLMSSLPHFTFLIRFSPVRLPSPSLLHYRGHNCSTPSQRWCPFPFPSYSTSQRHLWQWTTPSVSEVFSVLLVRSEPPEFSPDLGAAFYQSLYFASPPTNPLCFRWTKALSLALSLFYFLCNLLTSNMFTILKSYPHSPKPQNQISIWKSNRHSTTKLFTFLSLPLPPETHDLLPH